MLRVPNHLASTNITQLSAIIRNQRIHEQVTQAMHLIELPYVLLLRPSMSQELICDRDFLAEQIKNKVKPDLSCKGKGSWASSVP